MQLQLNTHLSAQPGRSKTDANDAAVSPGPLSLKSMILRLEMALGYHNLGTNLLLVEKPQPSSPGLESGLKVAHLLVGYSGSPRSQSALDLALCMAHQTRLAQSRPVTVHVLYVANSLCPEAIAQAEQVLNQARCMASEWRGALTTHLRIGSVATELSQMAQKLEADILLLGCHQTTHPLVAALADPTPCSVMGLPDPIESCESFN